MKSQIVIFFALVMLSACSSSTNSVATQQPTLADYQVGEKWVWKYRGVTTEEKVRSDGEDTREIVRVDGVLGMTIGNDTIPVTDIVKPEESETPKYGTVDDYLSTLHIQVSPARSAKGYLTSPDRHVARYVTVNLYITTHYHQVASY